METRILVEGMHCKHCVMAIEKSLTKLPLVSSVYVCLVEKEVRITHQGIEEKDLVEAILDAGYEVVVK